MENRIMQNLLLLLKVSQEGGLECWLATVTESVRSSLATAIKELANEDPPSTTVEDWAHKVVSLHCLLRFLLLEIRPHIIWNLLV
jgi:hypothetical protein